MSVVDQPTFDNKKAGVMELADVTDSKSVDGDIVWVRVPPPAPRKKPLLSTRQERFFLRSTVLGSQKRLSGRFCVRLKNS